jgi:dTDP-4-amino-4,6-dideoxygalactose transaminase
MIPFNNPRGAHLAFQAEMDAAIQRVIDSGWYILGREGEAFEAAFAAYHGVAHAVGVANGTDALELALRAAGVGVGDEVITVSHTAVATVCAIERAGARPVLVDIDPDTYTLDPRAAAAAITSRTCAIIPVHLYGHPADMDAITALASRHDLLIIEDCAQAHGARWRGRRVGTFGHMAAFSFYPTKNLGALGDGGAVITNDVQYAGRMKRLRTYGQSTRYVHDERGVNSRLDELQAAILGVKLPHLDEQNARRHQIARQYDAGLADLAAIPIQHPDADPVHHLYVVRHPERDALIDGLKADGIGTLIHYAIPVHLQAAYADLGCARGSLPITERACSEIVSLPLYIGLDDGAIARVIDSVRAWAEVRV